MSCKMCDRFFSFFSRDPDDRLISNFYRFVKLSILLWIQCVHCQQPFGYQKPSQLSSFKINRIGSRALIFRPVPVNV